MVSIVSHFEKKDDLTIAVTTDGVCTAGFDLEFCDPEVDDVTSFHKRFVQAIRQLDPSVLVRVELTSDDRNNLSMGFPRSKAISEIGFIENSVSLYIDVHPAAFNFLKRKMKHNASQVELLVSTYKTFLSLGMSLKPKLANSQDLKSWESANLIIGERSLETPTSSIGVVRLLKNPEGEFNFFDLNKALQNLPRPYRYTVSFQRMSEAKAQVLLERRLKQLEGTKRIAEEIQLESTRDALSDSFKAGVQLFETEALLTLGRDSQRELSRDLRTSQSTLSLFSECMIETFGVLPSFAATLPGSRQHVVQIENEGALIQSLPIFMAGSPKSEVVGDHVLDSSHRSLTLHRNDNSLFQFDLFNPNYNAFNALIVGPSGKGKSVLAGLLTSAILGDPKVHVIKIDVGSSHSKECELLQGKEYHLSLDQPSGLNPLRVVSDSNVSDSEKVAIVSKFLAVLVQELGESSLTKDLRSQIESTVRRYIDSKPTDPNLNDFVNSSPDFPRRNLLSRWVKGGLYEAAFASLDQSSVRATALPHPSHRLSYFNFSSVFQAADPEFSVAGFAALLAEFNIQALAKDGRRLVLVLDEIPFFIKHCFELIKFTVANMRKYGHAVVCVAQLLEHLIVNDDMGIIENTPQKFLFGPEAGPILELGESHIHLLKTMQSIPGQYSEVGLQTEEGLRKLIIRLSKEEYWERTSSKTDKEKMRKLLEAVPGLTTKEAITCLALKG